MALLEAISAADVKAMPAGARHRFAAVCRRCADLAEPQRAAPKAGVLADLKDGKGRQ
jgi:hypothetical protein